MTDHLPWGLIASGATGMVAATVSSVAGAVGDVEPTQVTAVSAVLVVCGLIARLWMQDRASQDGVEVRLRENLNAKDDEISKLRIQHDEIVAAITEKLALAREGAAFMSGRCHCGAVEEWRAMHGMMFPEIESETLDPPSTT